MTPARIPPPPPSQQATDTHYHANSLVDLEPDITLTELADRLRTITSSIVISCKLLVKLETETDQLNLNGSIAAHLKTKRTAIPQSCFHHAFWEKCQKAATFR